MNTNLRDRMGSNFMMIPPIFVSLNKKLKVGNLTIYFSSFYFLEFTTWKSLANADTKKVALMGHPLGLVYL